MCGIIGYVGSGPAKGVLLDGLTKLEYRGYDSAGIALAGPDGAPPRIVKTTQKVAALAEAAAEVPDTNCGIGHTRWATHGGVSEVNAHPHRAGRVTLVHNGIIENYQTLRDELTADGYAPVSQTDTEIAAMLIDSCYTGDPLRALGEAMARMEGAYTFAVLFQDRPGEIYAVCRNSPLTVMQGKDGCYLASDVVALLEYGREYRVPAPGVIVRLTAGRLEFLGADGSLRSAPVRQADWSATAADKDGYPHYMLKEIYEQPRALRETILPRLKDGKVDLSADGLDETLFRGVRRAVIVGCGTAMHAGLASVRYFEAVAGIPVEVEVASEFRDRTLPAEADALHIFISQSGETADTLGALRNAQGRGASRVLSIVNARGSSLARESGNVLYTHAGPEIAVASTKAFTAQVAALYLTAQAVALANGRQTSGAAELAGVPENVERLLTRAAEIRTAAGLLAAAQAIFYLGRGMDMALAYEGALKLKEISYIHAEAHAAGELKHGVISLIEPGVPCVLIATNEALLSKALLCAQEVRSRGGTVMLITLEGWPIAPDSVDAVLRLPGEGGATALFPAAATLQLLAYECALLRGLPIDQPRNLAKSVTVE